jgi:hypothetical protein
LLRNIDGITAYYEPFNERRWFDTLGRGSKIDPTHRHVTDYWYEYEGLHILSEYYREEWTQKNLFMDATFPAPEMKRYVELLIDRAAGRPVLQFNRIDLRLPWFRHHFPGAKIVHLYRHPRDQWCSFLQDPTCFPKYGSMDQFLPHDKFYLCMWARDLKYHFPFLDEKYISHPYQMFYYLWRLSYIFGIMYAHYSISFEDLVTNSEEQLRKLLHFLEIDHYDHEKLQALIDKPAIGKWQVYADDDWFRTQEALCESILDEFFSAQKT